MYPGIELRPLRYVIAVAQERHFARAALRVHVARSSLSKSIRDIEDYVGVPLFERTTREVELTPAGRAFIEDGARALTYAERAIHRARAANGANNGSLSLAILRESTCNSCPSFANSPRHNVPQRTSHL